MSNTKRSLVITLILVIIAVLTALMMVLPKTAVHASGDFLDLYEGSEQFSLSITRTREGGLKLNTTKIEDYKYQYYLKQKTSRDTEGAPEKDQYIWQLVKGWNVPGDNPVDDPGGANYTITDTSMVDSAVDVSGNIHVIVRVKNGEDFLGEVYSAIPYNSITPVISSVKINDRAFEGDYVIVRSGAELNITIETNDLCDNADFLYNGKSLVNNSSVVETANGKTFSFDTLLLSELNEEGGPLAAGLHTFVASVSGTGGENTRQVKIYIFDEYVAAERAIITSLKGTQVDSTATFTMKVRYADGTRIQQEHIGLFKFTLLSEGKYCDFISSNTYDEDGNLLVVFSTNYGSGNYGIYYMQGTVSRKSVSGPDDKVIQYYSKYARESELILTAQVYDNDTEQFISYGDKLPDDGDRLKISVNTGNIKASLAAGESSYVPSPNLRYAFYREDASGWVLIKDYPKDGTSGDTFYWTPAKAGTYNIQARIKDVNAGAYEKSVTYTYTIGGAKEGVLTMSVTDYEADTLVTDGEYYAGIPYLIDTTYSGDVNMLYMYTLTSTNLGTVYLTKFSPSSRYMLIPTRPDDSYVLTVRAIGLTSFGYRDLSYSMVFKTKLYEEEIRTAPSDILMTKENYDIWQVADAGVLSLSYDDEQSAMKLDKLSAADGILYIGLNNIEFEDNYGDAFFRFAYKGKKIGFYVTNSLDTLTGECDLFSDSTDAWGDALINIKDVLKFKESARYFVIKITGDVGESALLKDWTVTELTDKQIILYNNKFSYKNLNKVQVINSTYINTAWDFENDALKITSKNSTDGAGQQTSQSRGLFMSSNFIFESLEKGIIGLKFTVMYDNAFAGYANRNLSVYSKKNNDAIGESTGKASGNMVFANYGKSLTVDEKLQGLAEFAIVIDFQDIINNSKRVLEEDALNYLAFIISNATDNSIYFKDFELIEATKEGLEEIFRFNNEHNKWWIRSTQYIKTEWDAEKEALKVTSQNSDDDGRIGLLGSVVRGIYIDCHFLNIAQSIGLSELKFTVMYNKAFAEGSGTGVAIYSSGKFEATNADIKRYNSYFLTGVLTWQDGGTGFMESTITININNLLAGDSNAKYMYLLFSNFQHNAVYLKNFEFTAN